MSLGNLKNIFQTNGTTTGTPQMPQRSSLTNLNSNFDDVTPRGFSSLLDLKTITGTPQLPLFNNLLSLNSNFDDVTVGIGLTSSITGLKTITGTNQVPRPTSVLNEDSDFDNFISPALTTILNELPTGTNDNNKAFFPEIPQPYSGNPPNSNLINFDTTSDTSQKAFFPEIPQPYSGNPPNSNLINFNSLHDNFPTTIPTNPPGVFGDSSPLNSFNTTPIEELFTESSFPENYTPMNRLNEDGLFVNNDVLGAHSWANLYNSDHTSKTLDNPSPRSQNPFQPFTYKNSGDLDIRDNGDTLYPSLLSLSRGNEPYIVSELPTKDSPFLGTGRLTNLGSRNLPAGRAITDFIRVGSYLSSPQGIANMALKNADLVIAQTVVRKGDKLIKVPQRFNNGYNPIATLSGVGTRLVGQSPLFTMRSGFGDGYGEEKLGGLARGDTPEYKLNDTFTKGKETNSSKLGFLKKTFGLSNEIDKSTTGDKMTLAPMITGISLKQLDTTNKAKLGSLDVEDKKEGMPFYFKDLRDKSYIFFRAYIESLTEDITPNWSETNYVGRSEAVYVYQNAKRSISFQLKLVAQTRLELDSIYEKMNKLTSLCYPEYAKDEFLSKKLKNVKMRMKPPLTKLRMGDLYGNKRSELLGFIDSINYTIPDEATYETEPRARVPKMVLVSISYTVIHDKVPEMGTKDTPYGFYGFTGEN